MTQILNKQALKTAIINKDFFPYCYIKNSFNNNQLTEKILTEFPQIKKGGSFNISSTEENSINKLIDDFKSPIIKSILSDKFNVDLVNASTIATLRGYSRRKDGNIHSDSSSKILTILIYLNKTWDHENGLLRLLKTKDNLDDYIVEIPANLGSMVIFKVTNNCWHGYKSFEGERKSIQINYVHKRSHKVHLIRHSISSFFKKFKV